MLKAKWSSLGQSGLKLKRSTGSHQQEVFDAKEQWDWLMANIRWASREADQQHLTKLPRQGHRLDKMLISFTNFETGGIGQS